MPFQLVPKVVTLNGVVAIISPNSVAFGQLHHTKCSPKNVVFFAIYDLMVILS